MARRHHKAYFGLPSTLTPPGYAGAVLAEITLGAGKDAEFLDEVEAALDAAGADIDIVAVTSDRAYRLDAKEYDTRQADLLAVTALRNVGGGLPLVHEAGTALEDFKTEILDFNDWLETLIGAPVLVFAWPQHRHDREALKWLRDAGFLAARNGYPTYEGQGSFLASPSSASHVNHIKTWEKFQRWDVPLWYGPGMDSTYLNTLADKAAIYNYLYDTANYQSAPVTELYGYGSIMEAAKANRTWLQTYCHDELDANHLTWLLELIRDDGDFWIESFGVVAAYAADRHVDDATYSELQVPTAETADSVTPWAGKKCAFTFSTDDSRTENATVYMDVCDDVGIRMTAFLRGDALQEFGGAELSNAQIQALHNSGIVEIGNHTQNHGKHALSPAVRAKISGSTGRGLRILDDEGVRTMQILTRSDAAAWHAQIQALPGFSFLFDAADLLSSYGDGDTIASWSAAAGAIGDFTQGSEASKPTLQEAEVRHLPVSRDDAANDLLTGPTTNFGSDTNGLTLFAVVRWAAATGNQCFWGKGDSSAASRLFYMNRSYCYIYSAGGVSDSHPFWKSGGLDAGQWYLLIASWIPGQGARTFVADVETPAQTGGVISDLNLTAVANQRLHVFRHSTSDNMNGDIACFGALEYGFATGSKELRILREVLSTRFGIA